MKKKNLLNSSNYNLDFFASILDKNADELKEYEEEMEDKELNKLVYPIRKEELNEINKFIS